jgi:hypothetical protein
VKVSKTNQHNIEETTMTEKEAVQHLLYILRHKGVLTEKEVTEVEVRLS